MDRPLPPVERPFLAEVRELISVCDIEDGDATVFADEVVVEEHEPASWIGDVVI